MIILGGVVLLWLGGVVCVIVLVKQLMICCYTVQWRLIFEVLLLRCLVLIGLWLGVCWISWLAGGTGLVNIHQTYGILPLYV